MRKFYTAVTAYEIPDGFEIRLDGKPVKTPSGKSISVPTQTLADEIVKEWAAQGEAIDPNSMPLNQIMITALDRVAIQRDDIMAEMMKYLDTDLLCYRTNDPEGLGARQADIWGPWLIWFENKFAVALQTTTGLTALTQEAVAQEAVMKFVNDLDDLHFTMLQIVTAQSGSLVLALALVTAAITPEQLFDAAHVDEQYKAVIYNEEKYGADPLQEQKQETFKRDLEAAAKFLVLLL